MNKLLFILILATLSLMPLGCSVTIYPGAELITGNETYTVNSEMTFSYIVSNNTCIRFNNTYINISSPNTIAITLYTLNSDCITPVEDEPLLIFTADTTAGTVWFNISGFKPGSNFYVNRNGTFLCNIPSDANGLISFSSSAWSTRAFSIYSGTHSPDPSPTTPPSAPIITGPTNCTPNTEYTYSIVSFGDSRLQYNVFWGDGDVIEYGEDYSSGSSVSMNHIWEFEGDYTINAKAKNSDGVTSDWATLDVTVTESDDDITKEEPTQIQYIILAILVGGIILLFMKTRK